MELEWKIYVKKRGRAKRVQFSLAHGNSSIELQKLTFCASYCNKRISIISAIIFHFDIKGLFYIYYIDNQQGNFEDYVKR